MLTADPKPSPADLYVWAFGVGCAKSLFLIGEVFHMGMTYEYSNEDAKLLGLRPPSEELLMLKDQRDVCPYCGGVPVDIDEADAMGLETIHTQAPCSHRVTLDVEKRIWFPECRP